MKRKILSIMFVLVLIATIIVLITNHKVANQLLIGTEDIYETITKKEEEVQDINEIKINDLQSSNCTFYYNKLTNAQKDIYISIAVAIKNLDNKVKVKEYSYTNDDTLMSDVKISMQSLLLDHPEVFYVKNDYTVSTIDLINSKRIEIELGYTVSDKAELENRIKSVNVAIDEIVANTSGMDVFEKEVYVHDNICRLVTYYRYTNASDVPEECHNIYGCFEKKTAVCDGLSKAFQIALDRCGIQSIVITGNLQNQAHAWNMVKLNDEWYHVDITSNKSIKNENTNKEELIHSYFNITTEQIKKTNTIDMEDIIPIADNDTYNYYIKTGKYIDTADNFQAKLRRILDNNENDNLVEFAVDLKVKSVPEKMVYVFQDKKYSKYINMNTNKFNYYNILNSYVLIAKK